MSIFSNLFASKQATSANEDEKNHPIVKEQDFVDNTPPVSSDNEKESNIVTYDYGCGMPIDAIYVYIEKDWRKQGLEDSSVNADIHFMNSQVDIIKEGLRRRFDMIRLKYRNMISELNNEINNLTEMGLIGSVSIVNTRVDQYNEHIQKIDEMEEKLRNEDSSMMSMIESYKLGFKMGVALRIQQMTNESK